MYGITAVFIENIIQQGGSSVEFFPRLMTRQLWKWRHDYIRDLLAEVLR